MCGIVGILSKHGSLPFYADTLFTNMLMMDSIRGPDSTGVFGITSGGHVDWLKGDADGYTFTKCKQYGDFKARMKDYRIVIGHNRKATIGNVTAENAHPFREKHIIMVHNGTLRGDTGLKKTEVDSHAICHALADHDPVQALEKINGAYALVWYDASDRTLNLARNSERPLSLVEYTSHWVISSEVGLPIWLNGRETRKSEKILSIPEKKILTFKLDHIDKGFVEIPYEEYKSWTYTVPSYNAPHTTGGGIHHPALFRDTNNERVVPITSAKSSSSYPILKQGETIVFEFDDAKQDNGVEVLLGCPVIDNEKDENILVRAVLKKGEDASKYFFGLDGKPFVNKLWKATIINYRLIGGIPTVFIKDWVAHETVEDAQGESNDKDEVAKAVAQGCTRCKSAIAVDDVPQSIVRKRSDGSWRIVCPNCLNTSIAAATQKHPEMSLRARSH